jgi:hypothetical protein
MEFQTTLKVRKSWMIGEMPMKMENFWRDQMMKIYKKGILKHKNHGLVNKLL